MMHYTRNYNLMPFVSFVAVVCMQGLVYLVVTSSLLFRFYTLYLLSIAEMKSYLCNSSSSNTKLTYKFMPMYM